MSGEVFAPGTHIPLRYRSSPATKYRVALVYGLYNRSSLGPKISGNVLNRKCSYYLMRTRRWNLVAYDVVGVCVYVCVWVEGGWGWLSVVCNDCSNISYGCTQTNQ